MVDVNRLRIEAHEASRPWYDACDAAHFFIDGVDLFESLLAVERAHTTDSRVQRYLGPPTRVLSSPSRYLFGEPSGDRNWDDPSDFEAREVVIGGCKCGVAGCWPLSVRIEFHGDSVIWRNFCNWFVRDEGDDWGWSEIGVLVFERGPYEAALRALHT
jgi:hypothetical protein